MESFDWATFAAALITAILSYIGVYQSNRKQTALMEYRMKKLEEKVGQHNNLEGRVIKLETQMNDLHSA